MRYRAVVFDLFDTLIHFRRRPDPHFDWLREPFAAVGDAEAFAAFQQALRAVSMEIMATRAPEYREVLSRERFARALTRIGADDAAADMLATAHMGHLASFTHLPTGHDDVLARLGERHQLGLVSNFDHAPTAHAVLARFGLDRHLAVTLISADFGLRKPHPAIFHEALARLDVAPDEALYVGDTHADDVIGALGAGLDVAWLTSSEEAIDPAPTYRIPNLRALLDIP